MTDQGGLRVALVIFATHAQVAFPLTADYDHLLDAVTRIDADDLPPALRPRSGETPASGTRIGEALRLAVHVLDTKLGGDILLLSDGDDPARDEEWLPGAEEARRHQIPVHTIALGNPGEDYTIPWAGGVLEFNGQPVHTRVDEKPLKEIARRTGGKYLPAFTGKLLLGKLLPTILSRQQEEAVASEEDALPAREPRHAWFLGLSLLLLALTLLGSRGRADRGQYATLATGDAEPLAVLGFRRTKTTAVVPLALLACTLISAAVAGRRGPIAQGQRGLWPWAGTGGIGLFRSRRGFYLGSRASIL